MIPNLSGQALVAAVVGRPIGHTLSPLIHNLWLAAAGLDGVYVPLSPPDERALVRLVGALRGGVMRGLNVTAPFKQAALAAADTADAKAVAAGSANLLLFDVDGGVEARSTDGEGLLWALDVQAPGWDADLSAPAVVLGAGGAARAAVCALIDRGFDRVRVVNRTLDRAAQLGAELGRASGQVQPYPLSRSAEALSEAALVVNAAAGGPTPPLEGLPGPAVVMDMSYRPLQTGLLRAAQAAGHRTVDGLEMLIGQARPSFQALFGQAPPEIDVRSACEAALAR